MRIKGRVVAIECTDFHTVLVIVGIDEQGIGRRVEAPLAAWRADIKLGDAAEVEIDGLPEYYIMPAPKMLQ